MPLKLAANISTMFTDSGSFIERFQIAKNHGFSAVECTFPYEDDPNQLKLKRNEAGVEHVLMNAWPGVLSDGDCGLAASSDSKTFQDSIEKSIEYAKALQCTKMHVMSGKVPVWKDDVLDEYYIENISYAADRLQKEGITCLIEPICSATIPNYYMNHPSKAMEVIHKINHPNLKLQLDIFHLQMTAGNLTSNIKDLLPFTGHIQVSQAPTRNEPMSTGEIDYKYIFTLLEELGYDGWIGLEYKPSCSSVDSIASLKPWME